MVISLGLDPTIPLKWGKQHVWWRITATFDYEWRWQPHFWGYFR